ncbi:hypothetical protein ACFPZF_16835 [Kitasatospora cinereorecta]|uniref:CU044_5270 family protein n=1 Tax=Kitasatospora cinereorecta TaxID=285560 RepID=A0ABW0VAX8_9ACTN
MAAVVAAVLVSGAVYAWPGGTPAARAATPPPLIYHLPANSSADPATELEAIARRVETLPTDGGGGSTHLRWREWALWTRTDSGGTSSKVVPEEFDLLRTSTTATLKRFLVDQGPGSATQQPAVTTLQDKTPASPDGLRTWLQATTPGVTGPAGAAEAVHDLVTQRVLTPEQRAALLRLLAALPGLTTSGDVIDRAGRAGLAFSADSAASGLPTRYTFIIDHASGQLLGQETALTETAGKLNVAIPSVIGYDAYLDARTTP